MVHEIGNIVNYSLITVYFYAIFFLLARHRMKLLIHDLDKLNENILLNNNGDGITVISDDGGINPCICCFGCWIKTPGQCIIKDGYENMGALLSKCDQMIIISKCFYGSYSPFIKNVLDRTVCPYQLPYLKTINGRTRHPKRYKNKYTLTVHFYGDITEAEKETVQRTVKAYRENVNIYFYDTFEEINGV
jgi:multimeric flavodoxin WrbA